MTGLLILGFAVAVVLATSLFKQMQWSARTKNLIATVLSVLAGGITVYLTGGVAALTTVDLLQTITIIYGGSQAVYNFMLRGTAVEDKIAAVGSPSPELGKHARRE